MSRRPGGRIYLDTCVLLYAVESADARGDVVRDRLARTPSSLVVSPLVAMEALVGPIRSGDIEIRDRYVAVLGLLDVVELPMPVFLRAAELRASTGLRTPDALHLAAAQVHGCAALWTNDDRLAAASRGLALNVLA